VAPLLLALSIALGSIGLASCGGEDGPAGDAGAPAGQGPVTVAAAADLAAAIEPLQALYRRDHGGEVTVVLGSTGLLARQIAEGAPFDVFFAANVAFVDGLIREGHGVADTKAIYARGRIVLWTREGEPEARTLADLRDPRFRQIAIAQPEHAPYGLAAKQAIESAGLWAELEPRIVYGTNVSATLKLATSGNAEAAIVALSLAVATPGGRWHLVEETLHAPLDQALVVTRQARDPVAARAFRDAVTGPEGRAILNRFGFVLPGDVLDPATLVGPGR
jgi:molybdate transport system substrate-binding protein